MTWRIRDASSGRLLTTVQSRLSGQIGVTAPAPAPAPSGSSALPTITAPGDLCFFVEGHGIDEDSVYAQVPYVTGHSRARRVWTVTERVVAVSAICDAALLADVDDWYENALLAGARQFAAKVRNQRASPSMLWWTARWVDFQTEMLHLGRGRVSGHLFLTGEGSAIGPVLGVLAMEVGIELLDFRSNVGGPGALSMEVLIALAQVRDLGMEVLIDLLDVSSSIVIPGNGSMLREDGFYILREDGSQILRE